MEVAWKDSIYIVTQSGSARGSKWRLCPSPFQILLNPPKSLPKPSQNLPKSSQNRSKIDTKSIQKASWRPSWTNVKKKLDFERPQDGQEAPKSAQETPQIAPDPSKMEPKTLPKPIFMRFFTFYFPTPNVHRFFRDFLKIF